MKRIIQKVEETLDAIKHSELLKYPKTSAKVLEIKQLIAEIKRYENIKTHDSGKRKVHRFINSKVLLEN